MNVEQMLAERKRLLDEAKAIQATADSENRSLTEEEESQIAANLKRRDELAAAIDDAREAERRQAAIRSQLESAEAWDNQSQRQQTRLANVSDQSGNRTANVNITGGEASGRWSHFGEFAFKVYQAGCNNGVDGRLMAGPTGSNTATDSEGGFLVPPQFSQLIVESMFEQGEILSRITRPDEPLRGNTLKIPYLDETSRATGSRAGGITAYWVEQGGTFTPGYAKFGQQSLTVHKVAALSYVTEEMMEEAPAAGSLILNKMVEDLTWVAEDSIINGSGAGQPLGILNAGCLVSQTKVTNQTADTIWGDNIVAMFSRMPARARRNAVWLINQDAEPQMMTLMASGRFGSASTDVAGMAIENMYLPPGSALNRGEFGLLMGKPVIPVEYCKTVGDKGDVIFASLPYYLFVDKGAAKTATSIHVKFTTDEQALRATYRCDGSPRFASAITPANSTTTLSPFVSLDARE